MRPEITNIPDLVKTIGEDAVHDILSDKTPNIHARVEEDVKKEAEDILSEMGIPASVRINMFYRQIIYCHGLPFRPVAPGKAPHSLGEMTRDEFDSRMAAGLADAKTGRSVSVDEAFDQLMGGLAEKEDVNASIRGTSHKPCADSIDRGDQ